MLSPIRENQVIFKSSHQRDEFLINYKLLEHCTSLPINNFQEVVLQRTPPLLNNSRRQVTRQLFRREGPFKHLKTVWYLVV